MNALHPGANEELSQAWDDFAAVPECWVGILTGAGEKAFSAGVAVQDSAEAIGQQLNLPVASIPAEQAGAHFGWFAPFVGLDAPTSSARTRAVLNWHPEQPGLLQDIARPEYFGR